MEAFWLLNCTSNPCWNSLFDLARADKPLYDGYMSFGKRRASGKKEPIPIEAACLATPVQHPFCQGLNRLVDNQGSTNLLKRPAEAFM